MGQPLRPVELDSQWLPEFSPVGDRIVCVRISVGRQRVEWMRSFPRHIHHHVPGQLEGLTGARWP